MMRSSPENSQNRPASTEATCGTSSTAKPLILLFFGVVILAFFTSHATLSIDPPNRYLVAKSLVDHGDLQMRPLPDEATPPGLIRGVDGHYYTHFGVGQSLIFVGPYWFFHHLIGIQSDKIIRSLISITLFPLTLGLTAVMFYALIREFGISRRQGYLSAILLIFATGLWQVSKEGQEDCHLALCFVAALYGLRRYQLAGGLSMLTLSAISMGFAFLIRSDIAPTIMFYLVFAFFLMIEKSRSVNPDNSGERLSYLFWTSLLLVVLMAPALFIHSAIYYTHFHRFLTPPFRFFSLSYLPMGLKGLLFSPGRSVFLYNPILVLSFFGLVLLWRNRFCGWAIFIVSSFIGCLVLHASLSCFHGNCCWGPRYMTREFPFVFIAIAFGLSYIHGRSKSFLFWLCKTGSWMIVIVSILIQILAVSGHHVRELYQLQHAYHVNWSDRQWTMFEPEANFLKGRLVNLKSCIEEMSNDTIAPWDTTPNHTLSMEKQMQAPVLRYLAFWPYHLTYYLPAVKPQYAVPLWVSTSILIVGVLFGLILLGLGGFIMLGSNDSGSYNLDIIDR